MKIFGDFDMKWGHLGDTVKNILRRTFLENLSLKFISIVITFTLFVIVVGEKNVEITKEVKLEILTASTMMVTNELPSKINIHVIGPKSIIRTIQDQSLILPVDLTARATGDNYFRIHPDLLTLPHGLIVTHIAPASLYPRLEKLISKVVPVQLQTKGELPRGYRLKSVLISPQQVEIIGPESHLVNVSTAVTEPFDLSGKTERIEARLHLLIPSPYLTLKNKENQTVTATLEIVEIGYEKE